MRRLLFPPALLLCFALLSCDGQTPSEPETASIAADPLFGKPIPILIEDYDFLRMQFKRSKSTGLTIKITFKNMSVVPCGAPIFRPTISLKARTVGSIIWSPAYILTGLCDEPGGGGASVAWTGVIKKGVWEFQAELFDDSPDVDVILKQYTNR